MKQIFLFLFLFLFAFINGFSQVEDKKHFEVDLMLGMHNYSNSYFHAVNKITWIQNPETNTSAFSGYGESMLPAINVSYFLNNNIGVTAGFVAISANNELYIDDTTGTNYDFCMDQYNISIGIAGRIHFEDSPISLNVGSGFIAAPFDISQNIESNSDSYYMSGNNAGIGFYGNASFQLKIVSFLRFKTEFAYSFIPAEITLNDSDKNVQRHINNLNVGGITLKAGLSAFF